MINELLNIARNEHKLPLGCALISKTGEVVHFRSRVRNLFGEDIVSNDYLFTAEELKLANEDFPSQAPHRVSLVYEY